MRKPDFCLCKNKGADQLCSNCTANQGLCFHYMDSIIPPLYLYPKFQDSSFLMKGFMSDMVRNPEDWFSRIMAQSILF